MKRNKRSLFRNPLNFTFKKPIPVKRNNQKEKECKNSQINLGIVSQGKTEANFPKDRENENEKYMIRNEKNQVQGKTIQKEKSNNKNSQRKTNLINDNNNQNLNLNNKKNIVVTYQKNINYEIEKKKHQRPKLEITLNEIEKESHNPNENENKDTKEIQKGKGEEKGKGKGKGNLVQNQNNSISNTENNHTNIHNNPNIQSWNKLSKFENFVKDRKMSLEFPEFFQKIEGNKSFYDYYLKNAFNNNPLKKKIFLKKSKNTKKTFN